MHLVTICYLLLRNICPEHVFPFKWDLHHHFKWLLSYICHRCCLFTYLFFVFYFPIKVSPPYPLPSSSPTLSPLPTIELF